MSWRDNDRIKRSVRMNKQEIKRIKLAMQYIIKSFDWEKSKKGFYYWQDVINNLKLMLLDNGI